MLGKHTVFSFTLAVSSLTFHVPVQAGNEQQLTSQTTTSETISSNESSSSQDSTQLQPSSQSNGNSLNSETSIKRQIPQSAAIVAGVPRTIKFNASQDQPHPISLRLLQPLRNGIGEIAIPKNAVISAQVKPTEQGARLVAQSIIIQGRSIPVKASSQTIPAREVKVKDSFKEARRKQQTLGRLGHSVAGVVGDGSGQSQKMGGLAGSAVGLVSSMASSDEIEVVSIQKGTTFVLPLSKAIELP